MNRVDVVQSHLQDNLFVRVEKRGGVGLIRMLSKAPPLSQVGGCVLGRPMRAQLLRALRQLEADDSCHVILLSSTSTSFFSSGINIADFTDGLVSEPTSQPPVPSLCELTRAVEECPKLVIAAIQGLCSSWGLELALAADYRVASVNAVFRFPEAKFGITPCGGGALRLVKTVGVPAALDMLSTARPIYVQEALQMGLIDTPASPSAKLWKEAEAFVKKVAQHVSTAQDGAMAKLQHRKRQEAARWPQLRLVNRGWFAWTEHKLRDALPRGLQSPYKAVEAVRLAVRFASLEIAAAPPSGAGVDPMEQYNIEEENLFGACLNLPEAQATQHLLRASQRTSAAWEDAAHQSVPAPSAHTISPTASPFAKVAVIGAGTMGTSVALMLLWNRSVKEVHLIEMDANRQLVARRVISQHLKKKVEEHRLSQYRMAEMLSRLFVSGSPNTPFPAVLAEVDLVLECAPEVASIKQNIFAHLDQLCKRSAIFATGSSGQDVNVLASMTSRPTQVLGIHLYPPANESPLVEVILGAQTERAVVQRVMHLLRAVDKYPIVSKSHFGYVGTRLLLCALYQAYSMVEDGCFPYEIDRALRKVGFFTKGLFELEDIMGLDVMSMARHSTVHAQQTPAGMEMMRAFEQSLPGKLASLGIEVQSQQQPPLPRRMAAAKMSFPSPAATAAEELRQRSNAFVLPSRDVFNLEEQLVKMGALGRKTGEGWYKYVPAGQETWAFSLLNPLKWLGVTGSSGANAGSRVTTAESFALAPGTEQEALPTSDAPASSSSAMSGVRYPIVSLKDLSKVHNFGMEYRTLRNSKEKLILRRDISDEEIVERILLVLVNEAAKILNEGIMKDATDIDCTSVYAFGFPVWKGGICYHADRGIGIDQIVYRMMIYNRALGSWAFPVPSAALLEMQARKMSFADFRSDVKKGEPEL